MKLLSSIVAITWVVQNWKTVLFALIVFILLICLVRAIKNRNAKTVSQTRANSPSIVQPIAPKIYQEKESQQSTAETAISAARNMGYYVPSEIEKSPLDEPTAPMMIGNKSCAYKYKKVAITPKERIAVEPLISRCVSFYQNGQSVVVLCCGVSIGTVKQQQISEMIADWMKKGEPIWAMITWAEETTHEAAFDIYFYRDELAYQLKRNPDAKQYRLTGNGSGSLQDQASSCEPGQRCTLEFDDEKEKYIVLDGWEIGYLPASAAKIVQEEGEDHVEVFISNTTLDDDGKTIVYVYVFS